MDIMETCLADVQINQAIDIGTQNNGGIPNTKNGLSFRPIIVVHNLNGEKFPQIRNSVEYMVTSKSESEVESSNKLPSSGATLSECDNEYENYDQKPLIIEQMAILEADEITKHDHFLSASQALKTISPTEFLADYVPCETNATQKEVCLTPDLNSERNNNVDIDLDGFCSPLLSDTTKEMGLDNENHLQDKILDVMVPKIAFSETPEPNDDLFVTNSSDHNDEKHTSISKTDKTETEVPTEKISFPTSSPPQDHNYDPINSTENCNGNYENTNNSVSQAKDCFTLDKDEANELPLIANVIGSSTASSLDQGTVPETTNSVMSGYVTVMGKVTGLEAAEIKNGSDQATTTDFPLTTVDVGVISIVPVESVVLGNITLLPQTSSSIKFQVVQEDGSTKCVSVDPVFQTEPAAPVCSLDSDNVQNEITSTESTTLVAEVVTPVESCQPFKCELCSATFNRLGNYTRHKKIHTVPTKEDQRFVCEICNKNFIQRCDLTRHVHIHNGTEPHRCTICGKGYLRHSDLVTHQRFHNKEKPFTCPHCNKGFCQKGDLNRHLRSIHFRMKPLTCGHCQKKFAKESTLIRHMQVSHRDIILCSVSKSSGDEQSENQVFDVTNTMASSHLQTKPD